jgi:energy-coupling factor transporter ATP-binding protein EcfA2
MRFQSDKIKFVAVDEPSSALDAEGELRLFEELIKVRSGKTMIFVTHRFGHLTKYADKIMFVSLITFFSAQTLINDETL